MRCATHAPITALRANSTPQQAEHHAPNASNL